MKSFIMFQHGERSCSSAPGEDCRFAGTNSFGRVNVCTLYNNYPLTRYESGPLMGQAKRCDHCLREFGDGQPE